MAKSLEHQMDRISISSESAKYPVLAGYECRKKLGQGGFGTVWLCFDRKSGGDVAVKQLSIVETLDANARKVMQNKNFNLFS